VVVVIHYRWKKDGEDNISLVKRTLEEFPFNSPTITLNGIKINSLDDLKGMPDDCVILIQ